MAYYLSRFGHVGKNGNRKQRTDIGKYSFVNRTIKICNQLPVEALGTLTCKHKMFRNLVMKAIISWMKRKEYKCGENHLNVQ